MPKRYPSEFKSDVVKLALSGEVPKRQIAEDVGISETTLFRWIKQHDLDADGYAPFVIDVVGGTGRFANATGVVELTWFEAIGEWGSDDLPIEPWFWAGEFAGSISY